MILFHYLFFFEREISSLSFVVLIPCAEEMKGRSKWVWFGLLLLLFASFVPIEARWDPFGAKKAGRDVRAV